MSIVEFNGPPSWSLYANDIGESTKYRVNSPLGYSPHHPYPRAFCTFPRFTRIKMAGRRTQRSTSTILWKNRELWTVYFCLGHLEKQAFKRSFVFPVWISCTPSLAQCLDAPLNRAAKNGLFRQIFRGQILFKSLESFLSKTGFSNEHLKYDTHKQHA